MPYLKLHKNGETCFVNIDYLIAVEPDYNGSKMILEDGVSVRVDENADKIWKAMDDNVTYFEYEDYDDYD